MIPVPGHEAVRAGYRLLSLELPAAERECLLASLSEDELKRGDRLLDRNKAAQFLVGRGLLRKTLAELTGVEPGSVKFSEGEFGKLNLAGQAEEGSLHFNLSHAGQLLLLAVAHGAEVGVDLEEVRQDLEFAPMARRYFSQREREELFSLAPEEQLASFYRCWTRKEAYLKGTGAGFSQPSTCFDVPLLEHEEPSLLAHRLIPAEVDRWSICDLPMPRGYCAAIAVENPKKA